MPQFFTDEKIEKGAEVDIRGAEAHHILNVLRLKKGDWLVLSDGLSRSFRAHIMATRAKGLIARIEEEITRTAPRTPPVLAIAFIKPERLEWAVQKCVELGCSRFMPFVSERTVLKIPEERTAKKIGRFERIALAAAKQSGLPIIPTIEAPISFATLCQDIPHFSPAILLYEGERTRDLHDIWKKQALATSASTSPLIIIGPEGGFTSQEVEQALASGATTASLGSQILRVETAAIATMAICQFELGNMDATLPANEVEPPG
jgi:16S rRNA (uracil1498-N3)-methyltransferase